MRTWFAFLLFPLVIFVFLFFFYVIFFAFTHFGMRFPARRYPNLLKNLLFFNYINISNSNLARLFYN